MEMPPKEVIEAAELVGRWFAERNVTDWCLGPCASRAELENVKQVEFPRRVEKVVGGWRKKCDRLEADAARLDWLDAVNAKTNAGNGTTYGWKFDINHNRAALTDHNWPALKVREAIDAAMSETPNVELTGDGERSLPASRERSERG
jgi:hypothetical protein